jgi:hypothetical protein
MFRPEMVDAEFYIPNFKLFRRDRPNSDGGGSCIYVHKSLNVYMCEDFKVPDCIAVTVDCETIKLIVIVVYRSPSLTIDESTRIVKQLKTSVIPCFT